MKKWLKRLWFDSQGQDLIEYALMASFIAIAALAIFPASLPTIKKVWDMASGTHTPIDFRLWKVALGIVATIILLVIFFRQKGGGRKQ